MIIAVAPHIYHSNGTYLYHYHNLIFGLRQEVRATWISSARSIWNR